MSRKSQFTPEEKMQIVEKYLSGKCSTTTLGKEYKINEQTILTWSSKFRQHGIDGLRTKNINNSYSQEFKLMVVAEYLAGKISTRGLCKKYNISACGVVSSWVKMYNSHNELKSTHSGGYNQMTNGRKTTFEERIEIVSFCIANNRDYSKSIEKFNISYQQVYTWVRKYEDLGIDGLIDRRGRAKTELALTEIDKLQAENKLLQAKLKDAEMENILLKKLKELERGDF